MTVPPVTPRSLAVAVAIGLLIYLVMMILPGGPLRVGEIKQWPHKGDCTYIQLAPGDPKCPDNTAYD